jgi:hypothetical protein
MMRRHNELVLHSGGNFITRRSIRQLVIPSILSYTGGWKLEVGRRRREGR